MNTKLTLSLDKQVIELAKIYAKEKKVSLSFLIENYLQKIVSGYRPSNNENGSLVDELSGIITLPPNFDYKKAQAAHFSEKHK
ncbi:MAG: DUF6364 family protein [Bacteroidia bacterium]